MTFAEGEDKPRNDSIVFSAENSCKNPTTIFNMTTAAITPPSIYEPIPSETPNASKSTNIIALMICFTRILGQATPAPPSNYPKLSAQPVAIRGYLWGGGIQHLVRIVVDGSDIQSLGDRIRGQCRVVLRHPRWRVSKAGLKTGAFAVENEKNHFA